MSSPRNLRLVWLQILEQERSRRRSPAGDPVDQGERAKELLFERLAEMGGRLVSSPNPAGPGGNQLGALAEEFAAAEDWAAIEQICGAHVELDLAPAEAIALALTADLRAGVRLVEQYIRARGDLLPAIAPARGRFPGRSAPMSGR